MRQFPIDLPGRVSFCSDSNSKYSFHKISGMFSLYKALDLSTSPSRIRVELNKLLVQCYAVAGLPGRDLQVYEPSEQLGFSALGQGGA